MPARPPVGLRDLPALIDHTRVARDRRSLAADPDLTYLFWECTLRCNLRCTHCGSSCTPGSPVDELSTDEIIGAIDSIATDFDASRICCAITGGEPLLRDDLEQVIASMTAHGMQVGIVTNGTLLTSQRARGLVAAGMVTASISLDGGQPEHDAIRGPGTFHRALAAIGHGKDAGLHVEAITCVRPANLATLPALEDELRCAGADDWRLITIDRLGRVSGDKDPETWLEPPAVRSLLEFVARRREAASRREADGEPPFEVGFSCGGYLGPRAERQVRDVGTQCYAGLSIGGILADGAISACPSLPRDLAQGSIREQRFAEVWRDAFRPHRELDAMRHREPCQGCAWYALCLGGGLHERLAQPDDFCWLQRQHD
jgi:radical SAM protein with 4Fe4S-binding SPASM domain